MPRAQETRDELLATTPEAVRDLALERLKKRRDVKARKPITEEELQREIDRLEGAQRRTAA